MTTLNSDNLTDVVPHKKQRLWLARRDARKHVIGCADDVGAIVWFHRAVASRVATESYSD